MTTHAPVQASPPAAPPAELDLDARMALTLAEMDGRCTTAVEAALESLTLQYELENL